MLSFGLPILYALFVWWFSTWLIIYLDRLPRRTFRWSMLGASAVLFVCLYGIAASRADMSVAGAYIAFTCGLLAWGWQEISFYMGYVTGPRNTPCPENCSPWRRFLYAIQTSIYHELAIVAAALAIVWLTAGGANHIAAWTFLVLWWMHLSARLNVFLGVRNVNEELLPEHLQFLKSFLAKKPMNLLFPVSVTISIVIATRLYDRAVSADVSAFDRAGFVFLTTLMALAILEHWFLVVPLPAAKLWDFGGKAKASEKQPKTDSAAARKSRRAILTARRVEPSASRGDAIFTQVTSAIGVLDR